MVGNVKWIACKSALDYKIKGYSVYASCSFDVGFFVKLNSFGVLRFDSCSITYQSWVFVIHGQHLEISIYKDRFHFVLFQ